MAVVVGVALVAVAHIHQRVIHIQPILIGLTTVAGLRFTLAVVGQELALLHIVADILWQLQKVRFSTALSECGALSRFQLGIVGTNANGGSGGAGGKGQGYVSANASGSGGSSGGTNAGTGGTGGTGGTYGNSGGTGATGETVTEQMVLVVLVVPAGKYIRGISFVTYTNNGSTLAVQHDAR